MLGKLKKKAVRTLKDKKILRLRIDIPWEELDKADMDEEELLLWLDSRVDEKVSLKLGPVEDDNQTGVDSYER